MALTAWFAPSMLPVYLHTLRVRVRRHRHGHTRHPGDAAAVIRACIETCWNGRFFTASPGHFDMFWTRDLCFSTPSLLRLGEGERVRESLAYALAVWTRRRSHVTTTINYGDRPADVFEYGVDSLPLLLAALRAAGAEDLVERHRGWLAAEVAWFAQRVVDPQTGLVRADRTYSAHRDTVVNRSTAYGNTMVALLAKTLAETRWLPSPFERHFEGDHGGCCATISGTAIDSAMRSGTIPSRAKPTCGRSTRAWSAMIVCWLRRFGTSRPTASVIPIRSATRRSGGPAREVWLTRHVLPDYQGTTVWTSLGAIYLQLLRSIDQASARREVDRYRAWIERDGTYWEVLDARGRPWISPRRTFIGEESMLWSAIFLDVLEHGNHGPALLSPAARATE